MEKVQKKNPSLKEVSLATLFFSQPQKASIVILIFRSPEGPNMEDWGGEESDGLPPKLFMLEPACKFSFTILKFISETEMQDSVTIQL